MDTQNVVDSEYVKSCLIRSEILGNLAGIFTDEISGKQIYRDELSAKHRIPERETLQQIGNMRMERI